MNRKTYTTAVVLIPPPEIWSTIQAIRQVHDRHFKRWMPHITLLYPFRPRHEFDWLAERFSAVCEDVDPFRVELAEMRCFRHRGESFTIWLAPEPKGAVVRLQARLGSIALDCDDVTRHGDDFTPHLSLGQVWGEREMYRLKEALRAAWKPLEFTAREISLIWRRAPPDDVFRVGQIVRLGKATMPPTADS